MVTVDIEEMRVLFHIEPDEASPSIDFQLRRVRDGQRISVILGD